jgi:hypothetical protein
MHYSDVPDRLEIAGQAFEDSNGSEAAVRVWYGSESTSITVSTDPNNPFAGKRELELVPHVTVVWDTDVDKQGNVVRAHVSTEWGAGRNVSAYYHGGKFNRPVKLTNLTADERKEFWSWKGQVDFFKPIGEGFFEELWRLELDEGGGEESEPEVVSNLNVDAPVFTPQAYPAGWYPHPERQGWVAFWSGTGWTGDETPMQQ